MADKKKINPADQMSDIDSEMPEMDTPMMHCPMMHCPMMHCPMIQCSMMNIPMMNYMDKPMNMDMNGQQMMHEKDYDEWDMEDIYEDDYDSDYSSDDKEEYQYKMDKKNNCWWHPHPYYKKP